MLVQSKKDIKPYRIYSLPNGGYKIRAYLFNHNIGTSQQVERRNQTWKESDATREAKRLTKLGSAYFESEEYLLSKPFVKVKNANIDTQESNITLDELFAQYNEINPFEHAPSYIEGQKSIYKNYLEDYFSGSAKDCFKGKYITDIKQHDITHWKHWLNQKIKFKFGRKNDTMTVLRTSSKNNIVIVLKDLIKYGKEYEGYNLSISVPGYSSKKEIPNPISYWDIDDSAKFLSMIDDENILDAALLWLMFSTGIRISEARSVHPSKIDFKNKTILIDTSLCRAPGIGWVETTTKGHDNRLLKLTNIQLGYLEKQLNCIKNIHGYNPNTFFLFGGAKPIGITTARRKFDFYKGEMKAKYPNIDDRVSLHGIRHSVASDIATRFTPLQAKEQLGHQHQSTTDLYIHSIVSVKVVEDRTNLLLKYKTA